ncbi:hypothetical protein ACHAW6_013960 [Cyclotella cf. meneghiniana]
MRLSQIAELITDGLGPLGQALINLLVRKGARVITRAHQMHEEEQSGPSKFKEVAPCVGRQMDVFVDSLCINGYESPYKASGSR